MHSTRWSSVTTEAYAIALPLCKGCYQRYLLEGYEALSGSTLKGKARTWKSKYMISQRNFLKRLRDARLIVSESTGGHGARILTICTVQDVFDSLNASYLTSNRRTSCTQLVEGRDYEVVN